MGTAGPLAGPEACTYYLMHKWMRLPTGPLAYGVESYSSHKGTFVHIQMPNQFC